MSGSTHRAPYVARSGLLRVTVTSSTRRVDLALPDAVPVAELVPELARSVGMLDAATVHGGHRLVTAGGRELSPDASLSTQGVEDGGFLAVMAGLSPPSPPAYDDVVEAMADVVERDRQPWPADAGRQVALTAAGLLMALGALTLLLQPESSATGWVAASVSGTLVAAGILVSRRLHEVDAAVGLSWLGCAYAAVAGYVGPFGQAVVVAGGAALLMGAVALVGLRAGRVLAIPPTIVGGIVLATGMTTGELGLGTAVVPTYALVLVVVAGHLFPSLAVGVAITHSDSLTHENKDGVDVDRLADDARAAHEILLAMSVSTGLLLVLVAPLAVSLGGSGALLAVLACVLVMLRTRHYHSAADVLVGLGAGVLGLLSVGVATLLLHPEWRPVTAAAVVTTGAALLAATFAPPRASVRRDWLADIAETSALVALLPLLVVATDLLDVVRG